MGDFDFGPGTIGDFRGRMARGSDDITPSSYAISELNVEFTELGVETRAGFDSRFSATGGWNGTVTRTYEFKKRNEAPRLLILDDEGRIWDASTPMSTYILSIANMTDFSAETMYDKVFISPHDGERGLSNEKVYVYDGTGTARPAAGSGPSGYSLDVTDDADAGVIEAGLHLFSVAFETSSGHVTKFGLTGAEVKQYTAPGGKKCNITGIPTGSIHVVARWIIVTKKIEDYDGNPSNQSWYLLQRLGDNVTTVLNDINFFDSALVDSADRLLNQLAEIPAGSCITAYGSRLVVGGEIANDATARVSDAGYPESFSGLSGFVNFNPGDAGGALRMLISYREMLFGFKDYRALVTQDNGASPSSWKVNGIDDGHGTSVHGSSGVLDSKGQSLDSFVICTRSGVTRFTGTFGAEAELSYAIEDLWKRINPLYFHLIQIAVDPLRKRFYIVVPLDASDVADFMLVCDFSEGFSPDKVKWSTWEFPEDCSSCWVEVDYSTRRAIINYGSYVDGGTYRYNPDALNDHNNAIPSHYRAGYVTADQSGGVCEFNAVRLRVVGSGTLYLKLYGLDDVKSADFPSATLSATPGEEIARQLGFFSTERASVEFGVTSIDHWFHITKVRLASAPLWEDPWQT